MDKSEIAQSLIDRFNRRDKSAFADIYVVLFDEINHYATRLFYYTTIDPKDLIQDVFVTIWSNKSLKFVSFDHIKNYLYLAIKNRFKDCLKHDKYIKDYKVKLLNNEDFHFTAMVESSTLSILSEAITSLPEEYAELFRLYIEGYDTAEIAAKMEKSQSLIYKKRNEAITILKKTMTNKQLLLLLTFLK